MATVFTRLLLATEHSEFDGGAETLALAMARRCGLPLQVVLPLLSNPEFEALAPQVAAREEALAAASLKALAARAAKEGVAVELRARRGAELAREIVAEAAACGADLLVIRRRGRRGFLANLLLGQMVRDVVVRAPCSVLVAPRAAVLWSRQVLAAWDPAQGDMTPVSTGAAVAAECGLPLAVVCVGPHGDDVAQRARAAARGLGVEARVLLRDGRPHEQIAAVARELGADLLVVGRRGEESLTHAWLGGVAQKVIGFADVPVLVAVPATPQVREEA